MPEREEAGCPGKAVAGSGNPIASGRNQGKSSLILRTCVAMAGLSTYLQMPGALMWIPSPEESRLEPTNEFS